MTPRVANDFPNLLSPDAGRDFPVLEPTNVFCGELGLLERSGAQPPPRPQFQPLSVALSPDAS